MPITYSMNHDEGYLEIIYKGQISDAEFLDTYKSLLNSYDRIPATNNLTDISEADLTNLSSSAIQTLAEYSNRSYKEAGTTSFKTAIYAPVPIQFGLSRMFEALAHETLHEVEVFQDREKAIQWLRIGK